VLDALVLTNVGTFETLTVLDALVLTNVGVVGVTRVGDADVDTDVGAEGIVTVFSATENEIEKSSVLALFNPSWHLT
jgi:hypothetical protein